MRALFLGPQILLLDEPLGSLDPLIRAALQRDLHQVFERTASTVLLVTHDLVEASRIADRICVMNAGRIVQRGQFSEILERPADEFVREFINSQVVAP
jgi:osmoprotectant transport system ATP-binding protein